MMINIVKPDQCLKQLAGAIRRDPKSWIGWNAMYLKINMEGDPSDKLTKDLEYLLSISFKNREYTLYFCEDNELLIITHDIPLSDLKALTTQIDKILQFNLCHINHYQTYQLSENWRRFAFLCENKEIISSSPELIINTEQDNPFSDEETKELFELYNYKSSYKNLRQKTKVMVVEDDPLTRKIVSKVLKDEVDLIMAKNVHDGLVHYALHAPDIVFLDIDLERSNDGKAFLNVVRQHDKNSQIIMFSGNSYLSNMIETLEMGANGFIAKPFRKEQLMHYIESTIA